MKVFIEIKKKLKGFKENYEVKKYVGHSKYFDKKWYVKSYKIEKNISPYKHYYEIGYKKGFNPSIYFNTNKYLKNNPDVDMCPLYHYEKYGKKEGRKKFFADIQYDHNYKAKRLRRFIKRKISNIVNFRKIKKNKEVKILVYAHIFYVYSVPEIIEYLKNLEKYNYDLIVTCTDNSYYDTICAQISSFKKDTKIIKCENRGFDVGPFMEMLLQTNLNKYDVFFKLQSKSTSNKTVYVYDQVFKNRDWFVYMFESTLGAFYVHKNIEILSQNNNIGIIAASNLILSDPQHRTNFTLKHLRAKKLKINKNYIFVAGTVFAGKILLLKKIKNLNYGLKDFEPTETGYFSFAHAMERYVSASASPKYVIHGNKVCRFKRILWHHVNQKMKKIIGLRLLDDNRFNLSDDFVLRYIEHTPILKYEICKIKLCDLNVYRNSEYISIDKCYPFLFVTNANEKEYTQNCLRYRRTDYMDLSLKDFEKTVKKECVQRYRKLISSIDKKNNIDKELISVNEHNSILDGQHRACYLLHKYGGEYEINVLRIYEGKVVIDDLNPLFNKYK